MTREKWAKMSADERRIKIAELCGWDNIHLPFGWIPPDSIGDLPCTGKIPDYCNDLNAMHEAESLLQKSSRIRYEVELIMIVGRTLSDNNRHWLVLSATAAQRAEAFALTMEPES